MSSLPSRPSRPSVASGASSSGRPHPHPAAPSLVQRPRPISAKQAPRRAASPSRIPTQPRSKDVLLKVSAAAVADAGAVLVPTPSPSATAPVANSIVTGGVSELEARRRRRVVAEIVEAGKKQKVEAGVLEAGCSQLEALLPGLAISMDTLKASDWVKIVADTASTSVKIVVLKAAFPGMNVARVLNKKPRLLLLSSEQIQKDAAQIKRMLERAKNPDWLLEQVPELLTPKILASVLVTVNKWYALKKDPVAVLEADPDLIRRAQENDVPFDPVYEDEHGNFEAPLLNYMEKRTEWQAYIDRTQYKQK